MAGVVSRRRALEVCGARVPGTKSTGPTGRRRPGWLLACNLAPGHDGPHRCVDWSTLEVRREWPQEAPP